MKVLLILLLPILCKGLPIDTSPRDMGVSTHENDNRLWFVVSWSKVDNFDDSDPILGYKVKIWIVNKVKSIVYRSDSEGTFVSTEKEELPKLDLHKNPSNELIELDVPADKTEVTYHEMKKGVTYEIAVFAYTAKFQGSFSNKMRIEVEPDKSD